MTISRLRMRAALGAGCIGLVAAAGMNHFAVGAVRGAGQQWSHPPRVTINKNHAYSAVLMTTDGSFTIRLLPKQAPVTVNNFVFLARHHFYDGVWFHRIIGPFMVQTGDPTGTGTGGPGYTFKDEKVRLPYTPGTVAMANSGPNTNGSQFFIVTGNQASSLPPSYTIFGKVSSGWNVVQKIAHTPVGSDPASGETSRPLRRVVIKRVIIHGMP